MEQIRLPYGYFGYFFNEVSNLAEKITQNIQILPHRSLLIARSQLNPNGYQQKYAIRMGNLHASLFLRQKLTYHEAMQLGFIMPVAISKSLIDSGLRASIEHFFPYEVTVNGACVSDAYVQIASQVDISWIALHFVLYLKHPPDITVKQESQISMHSFTQLGFTIDLRHILEKICRIMHDLMNEWKMERFRKILPLWSKYGPMPCEMWTVKCEKYPNSLTAAYVALRSDGGMVLKDQDHQLHVIYPSDVKKVAMNL